MPVCVRSWSFGLLIVCVVAAPPRAQGEPRAVSMRVLWKFAPPDTEIRQLAASAGLVVVSCSNGDVVALHADDGTEQWRARLGKDDVHGLAFAERRGAEAVVVTVGKRVVVLERGTGAVRWSRDVPSELADPVVAADRIVAGGFDGAIHALQLADGAPSWTADCMKDRPADPPGFDGMQARYGEQVARPSPAATDGEIVVVPFFDQCRAVAVDARTGARNAVFQTRGWMFMRPVITDTCVIVGSQDDSCYCFRKATGEAVWSSKTEARIEASCVVRDGRVFQGSCDGRLHCFDLATGAFLWKEAIDSDAKRLAPVYEPPGILGDTLVLPALSGEVVAFDRASGRASGRLRPSPDSEIDGSAWAGGVLFVQTRKTIDQRGEEAVFAIAR